MRISYETLKILIDYGDISAYKAFLLSCLPRVYDAHLYVFDEGIFYFKSKTGNWFHGFTLNLPGA